MTPLPMVVALAAAAGWAPAPNNYTLHQGFEGGTNNVAGSKIVQTIEECGSLCASVANCAAASWNGPLSHFKDKNCNLHCDVTLTPSKGEVAVVVRGKSMCGVPPPPPPPKVTSCEGAPADWAADCHAQDLLFAADDGKVQDNVRPEVGNGFLASVVGAPGSVGKELFVAGVFNGCGDKAHCKTNPSHRAAVPPPLPMSAGLGSMAALDLRRAAYIRRYPDSTQLKMYAHRRRKSLLVVEVSKLSGDSSSVVHLTGGMGAHPNLGQLKPDIRWTVSNQSVGGAAVIVWEGVTLEAENDTATNGAVRPSPRATTSLTVVVPAQTKSVSLAHSGAAGAANLICAIRTSLESADPTKQALVDWQANWLAGSVAS